MRRAAAGRPCVPHLLGQAFADHGKTARRPMPWLHAGNGRCFGPGAPRDGFAGFRAQGAPAESVQFPPQGEDGPPTFPRFPQAWQPRVAAFLDAQGFPAPLRAAAPGSVPFPSVPAPSAEDPP